MVDFLGMMKKAEELQKKLGSIQADIGSTTVDGRSGGGMVVVTLSGMGELKGLKIDPSLFKEDSVEVLEDLIVAAHRDAKTQIDAEMQRRMKEMTGGIDLPPGMSLPF